MTSFSVEKSQTISHMAQMLKEKAEFTDVEGNIISQNETISNWVQNNLILNMEDRKFTIEF